MKKKVISMLMCFALLFALTACKEEKTGDENGGVPCPIEGLEWGMTVDECLAALSLTEEDVEIQRDAGENATKVTMNMELKDQKSFGYSIQSARLILYEDFYGLPVGLHNVLISFSPDTPVEDLQATVKNQIGTYMKEDVNNPLAGSDSLRYNTQKTLADADQSLVDKYFHWDEWWDIASKVPVDVPEKSDYPNGVLWVGKMSDQVFVDVDNTVATILEKAAEAEKK